VEGFDGSRVYFSPCGIGLGHVSRSQPVASELMRRNADVMFSTYLEGVDYAVRHGFATVKSPAISMVNDASGSIDLKMSTLTQGIPTIPTFMSQVNMELRYMKAFRPHVVVSDSRLSSIFAAKLLGVPAVLIINQFTPMVPRGSDRFMLFKVADGVIMTLIGRCWGLSDVVLIPDFPPPYTISVDSLRIPKPYKNIVRFVGAILPVKPEQVTDRNEVRKRLGVDKKERLIYAGISGPKAERMPLLSILEEALIDFPPQYKIVMSMGTPNGGSKPSHMGRLTKIPWVENRFDYLNACDLVISRAGHETLMQSICYRKPSIIIPVPNHPEQYGNARRAKEIGVAEAIHQHEVRGQRLISLADSILNSESYIKRLHEMDARKLGDGVENVVEEVARLLPR
jgi:UDP:flavonoid glycosyltransferase YjiC (YdhE family)